MQKLNLFLKTSLKINKLLNIFNDHIFNDHVFCTLGALHNL